LYVETVITTDDKNNGLQQPKEKEDSMKNKSLLLSMLALGLCAVSANAQTNATQIVTAAGDTVTAVIAVVGPMALFFIGLSIAKKVKRG